MLGLAFFFCAFSCLRVFPLEVQAACLHCIHYGRYHAVWCSGRYGIDAEVTTVSQAQPEFVTNAFWS